MGIYPRKPYWWIKFEKDPVTGATPRPPMSTKIYVDGGSTEQSKQNKADAMLMFQKACVDIRSGVTEKIQKPRILLRDYAKSWALTRVQSEASEEQSRINMIVNGIVPATGKPLGDYFLDDITADVVNGWRHERRKRVKEGTINTDIATLRVMLRDAAQYIDVNPLRGHDALGNKKWRAGKRDDHETRFFSRDEFERFIVAVQSRPVIAGIPQAEGLTLAYAAVETLLRRSSLLKLTWSLDRGTHLVPLKAKVTIKRSPVTANLRYHLDQLPRDTVRNRIFPSFYRSAVSHQKQNENRTIKQAGLAVRYWFGCVCGIAKIPHTRKNNGVTFHSFRHTGATWHMQAGKNPTAVMKLGGWKNANVFLSTYCHTDDSEVAAVANSLFEHLHRFPRAVPNQQQ